MWCSELVHPYTTAVPARRLADVDNVVSNGFDVIGIDEGQFFPGAN